MQPTVIELDPALAGIVDDQKTLHQLDDLGMCLFAMGHGRSSWFPDYTVVDAVERYVLFRKKANAGLHISEFYSDDDPVATHHASVPRYIDPELVRGMVSSKGQGTFTWRIGPEGRVAVVERVRVGDGRRERVADLRGYPESISGARAPDSIASDPLGYRVYETVTELLLVN